MDDETVLNLAKKRLQTLRAKSYSLERLAVRTILKNVRFYLDSDDQLRQLTSLPGILREKILQMLIKQRNIDDNGSNGLIAIFPYLLSSRTRYLELNGIMSFACPRRFKTKQILLDQKGTKVTTLNKETKCCVQLLRWIETLAPKVETLIIKQNNPFPETSDPSDEKPVVVPEMLHSLKKMQNLETLRVDLFKFKENDLLEMCKALPNLHNLNIHTFDSEPYPSPEIYTSSFCNVKQLTFNNNLWLADQCSTHLPHIEIVPFNQSEIFDWRRVIYHEYRRSSVPKTPSQRHICVDISRNRICPKEFGDLSALFPNVSCVTLILLSVDLWNDRSEYLEAVSRRKIDSIRELNLAIEYEDSELLILERFLSTYGQNLQTLNLSFRYPSLKIDLAIILNNCPKLETLSLVKVSLKTSPLPIQVFTELKDLELRYPDPTSFEHNPRYGEPMILSNILSAPKLEKVVLEAAYLDEADLLTLNSLIQEKKILSQLHTFHFYLNCYANEKAEYLTNIFKSACAFLPKLSDFKVGRTIGFDHPLFTCVIRKDDITFDECIPNLISLFDNEK